MAPEVFHKMDSYGDKADIWSLGTVLYEMLHGYPPFNVRNARDLVAAHQQPIKYSDKLSSNCVDLLQNMLKFIPEERLSFQQFFVHPFHDTVNYDSLIASKGSSNEASNPGSPAKNIGRLDSSGDDYVIIVHGEDEFADFIGFELNKHESFNLRQITMSLEGGMESANAIANLAAKIMENQGEVLSSLALYTKASLVLHTIIDSTERTVKSAGLT